MAWPPTESGNDSLIDYTLRRYSLPGAYLRRPQGNEDKGIVTNSGLEAGTPLLVVPLSKCWTKARAASECVLLTKALREATCRNPDCQLLTADSTWIALHLVHDLHLGSEMPRERKEFLALMPDNKGTLLSWSDQDTQRLQGSTWHKKVVEGKLQVQRDFEALAMELGPEVVRQLGLQSDLYFIACKVLRQYGMRYLAADRLAQDVLVPGLGLFESAEGVPRDLRVDVSAVGACTEPHVVLYAAKSYRPCESVKIAFTGDYQDQDYVDLKLQLPYVGFASSAIKDLANAITCEAAEQRPGIQLPQGQADMFEPFVEGGKQMVQVTLRLTLDDPLPSRRVMRLVGLCILSDITTASMCMDKEQGTPDVLSESCCEKRALAMIEKELKQMLKACPRAPDELNGARSKLAARLVAMEKMILEAALATLKSRLADSVDEIHSSLPVRSSLTALTRWPSTPKELEPQTEIGRSMAALDMCIRRLQATAKQYSIMAEASDFSKCMGKSLQSDLVAMHSCAHSVGLGEFSKFPSAGQSGDIVIQKHNEVARAMLSAKRAALAWQAAPLEWSAYPSDCDLASLAAILSELGSTCFCSHQFSEALAHFQQSLQLAPSTATLRSAEACAMVSCALSESVLAEPSDAQARSGLKLLKQRLLEAGYTQSSVPVPERLPLSLPEALAAGVTEEGHDDFLSLLRLFILHRTLSLQRVVALLGREACLLLIQYGALSVCRGEDFTILTLPEIEELLKKHGRKASTCLVFANVALQPLEGELLIASDFDYGATYGSVEPVPYVARDTCALIAAAKGTSPSGTVNEVLDAGCGTGALGIATLLHCSAKKVTFWDSNPRALRFAKFNAHINEVGASVKFVSACESALLGELRGSSFDLVMSSRMFQPNPASVITSKGPMYTTDQAEGLHSTWGLVSTVLPLIRSRSKACLLMSCLATNMDTFAKTLEVHIQDADMCAKIFRSPPERVEDSCIRHLTRDTTELERLAYSLRLQQDGVQHLTQALLLVMVRPTDALPCSQDKVEVMAEKRGLFDDMCYLQHGVQKAKNSMLKDCELQEMVLASNVEDESEATVSDERMYDMSWDDDGGSTAASDAAASEEIGMSTPPATKSPWEPKSATRHELLTKLAKWRENKMADGASWDELFRVSAFGWAPPVNTVSTWRICPLQQPMPDLPSELPYFAIVELEGITCPSSVKDAFRDTFGCQGTFSFDSKSKEFIPNKQRLKARRRLRAPSKDQEEEPNEYTLESIDDAGVVLLPFPLGCYTQDPIVALPTQALLLFQALAEKARAGLGPSVVVTLSCNAAGPVISGQSEQVSPAAAINAMSRTVRLEVPQLTLLNLDSDMFGASSGAFELCAQVMLELGSPDNNMEVAWRGKQRWIRALTLSASNPIRGSATPPPWCWGDAVVLITGGTGGLGIVSAEALVEAGARHIVLTSRSGQIQRSGQGLEERLDKMRGLGAKIILDRCDTSSEKQVWACLQRTRAQQGPLAVVIHAAGVLSDCLLDFQTKETMETSFAAKADGAWYLHRHTLTDDLKAFVCFSSTSSLVGNVGQVNYSGANGYMDGLCAMRAHNGLPALALMWPAVAGVGMAAAGILAKREFDAHDQVGVDVVKQVIRRCVCEPQPAEALVAVSPPCVTTPKSPQSAWFVEPLYTDYLDKELLANMKEQGMLDAQQAPDSY